ncbi:MAG: hypothetical protein K0B10_02010 [Vicingaceae bacterium]|nr:hypothetical protein [Vicingaceae bacterium]
MTTKTETKQFQYEIQAYQEDCVNNIISLFESLRQKANFVNVLTAHKATLLQRQSPKTKKLKLTLPKNTLKH